MEIVIMLCDQNIKFKLIHIGVCLHLIRSRKASAACTDSILPLVDMGLSLLPFPGFMMITMTIPVNTAIKVVTI